MLSVSTDSQNGGQPSSFSQSTGNSRHRPSMSRIPEQHDSIDFGDPSLRPRPIPDLRKTDSSLSDFSKGLSWFTSSSEFDSDGKSLDSNRNRGYSTVENSQTIIPENTSAVKLTTFGVEKSNSTEPDLIVSDFQEKCSKTLGIGDVSTFAALLQVMSFYTSQVPNAQAIYHLFIVLAPLLNPSGIDSNSRYSAGASNLSIPPSQLESILALYQQQLQTLQIYNPAVHLARKAFKSHSHFLDSSSSQVGFVCQGCSKPINNPSTKMRCESCSQRQSPCPICWQKYPALSVRKTSRKSRGDMSSQTTNNNKGDSTNASYPRHNLPVLWQSCLICGHGAHASCLQSLQSDPRLGGKCPTEGCRCDCIPGEYRKSLNREAAEAERRLGGGGKKPVRRDGVRVRESAAAKGARVLLESGGTMSRGEEKRVVFVD